MLRLACDALKAIRAVFAADARRHCKVYAVRERAAMSDIRQWLEKLGLGEYADAFEENAIDLAAWPHC